MEELFARWGLPAVYLGAVVEGDVTLVLAGVIAHLDMMKIEGVGLAGFLGLLTSDAIWFAVGRYGGPRLRNLSWFRTAATTVEHAAGRAGPLQLVVARVVYGTRVASMLFWGARGLSPLHFLALDALGCAWWTAALVTLGYSLSGSAEQIAGRVTAVEHWLLGGVVVAVAMVLGRRWWAKRRPPSRPLEHAS